MDSTKTITHISLCTGYGGIDLGLSRVIRGMRTIAYAEIDSFAIEVLLTRMEAGQFDAAPIWTDVRDFPWGSFHGSVDILSAGYPCQPFSHAGLRQGGDDPRHLWPHIKRGIESIRPAVVFLENVEGHISMGLSSVISDLEEVGYRCSWGIFSAEECGAPHRRNRVFILALLDATDSVRERGQLPIERIKSAIQDAGSDGTARRAENGDGEWHCISCGQAVFGGCGCDHGESRCHRCGEWTYPFYYSAKDGCSHCGTSWPIWCDTTSWPVVPVIRGSDDGCPDRVDRLRLLGNGVVPAVASLAFRNLLSAVITPSAPSDAS